jgi:murein L,D-transpeptidase YafK
MRRLTLVLCLFGLVAITGCASSKFKTYDGPEVTKILVDKGDRRMFLMHHDQVLRTYDVDLGFAPNGHKRFEGDGRTPEGDYTIDRRNPESAFHLSLGISYPNEADVTRARSAGLSPGGDIFIHGRPWRLFGTRPDWTAGCISVSNREMEEIYAMVDNDTPIRLMP